MNKITPYIILGLLAIAMVTGCDDEKQQETKLKIETSPSAKAEDDHKASGVYKGTFVGSSGTFKLVIQLDMIAGLLVMDEINTYVLTTADITTSDLGGAITNAEFIDESGFLKLTFSVEADGSNPSATLAIPGHDDIQVVVLKETSSSQVTVYEGFRYWSNTYDGYHEKGVANIVLDEDTTALIAYKSLEFLPLVEGTTISPQHQAWIHAHGYRIEENQIFISGNVGNLGLMKVPSVYPMIYPQLSITENEIKSVLEWEFEGITVGDSVRLKRKL